MTIPVNIRLGVQPTFPQLVQAIGPITVTKNMGIWTIGFNQGVLGVQQPPLTSWSTDYVLVWDSVFGGYINVPISAISVRNQRSITLSPYTVTGNDMILNVNISTANPVINLPLASTRNGVPVTVKDTGGNFAAHNCTVNATSPDLIDGAASVTLSTIHQSMNFVPFNDGVNSGWEII